MIIIKTLHFEDYEDFACAVSDAYDRVKSNDEYNSVDVVAKYEDAKEIIRELIGIGYGIASINGFGDPEWDGYDDAFIISLLEDEIWCEPVKRENGYIFVEADVVYIFDDCNSKIIPKIEADEIYEVEISDFDYDCENCEYHDMATASSATYEVNGKSVDKETYEKAIEDIEEKYLDGIRDMLLRYCEIQDEMNEWRKMLIW
nr:MAG TPA: hypothetical protein [Caudoviricetes sp.]